MAPSPTPPDPLLSNSSILQQHITIYNKKKYFVEDINVAKERLCIKPWKAGQKPMDGKTKALYTTPGGCHTQAFSSNEPQVTCLCNTDLCNMVTSPVFGGPLSFAELPQIPLLPPRPERPAYGMVGQSDVSPRKPAPQPQSQPQPQQPQIVRTSGDVAQLESQNMTFLLLIFSSIFSVFIVFFK